MVAEESFEKQGEEAEEAERRLEGGGGGSTSTLLVTGGGMSPPLPNVDAIYRQLSSKGILSYYGRQDSQTNEAFVDDYHQQLQQPSSSPPPHPLPSPPSFTTLEKTTDQRPTAVNISVLEDDGGSGSSSSSSSSSLKPSVLRGPRDLRLRAAGEVLLSAGRNAGCFAFLASVVYLAIDGDDFLPSLGRLQRPIDGRVAALAFLCLGAVTVPFQVVHALSEVKGRRGGGGGGGGGGGRTLVAQMLLSPVTRARLDERLAELRQSVPYVGVELRLRRLCCCCPGADEIHHRKLNCVLRYDSWADVSPAPTTACHGGGSRWVVVCKDYRWSGATTDAWIQEELKRFKDSVDQGRGSGRRGRRRASVEFVLDLQEGMSFPDAQAILVHPSALGESRFYSFRVYLVSLCLCLDSVYSVLFHVATKRLPDQRIVKIIRRNVGHRT